MTAMGVPKLFMVLLGCKPEGRHTEQHDIFFGIGNSVADLKQDIIAFWPEAKGKIHVDAWREVTRVNGFQLDVVPAGPIATNSRNRLFFINLGGYKKGEFDELHYKMTIVAEDLAAASKIAKDSTFYKHVGFEGAVSHIDDKYGLDVDDVFEIEDVLPEKYKHRFKLELSAASDTADDEIQLGYLPLSKL